MLMSSKTLDPSVEKDAGGEVMERQNVGLYRWVYSGWQAWHVFLQFLLQLKCQIFDEQTGLDSQNS